MADEIEDQGITGKKFSRRTLVKGGAIVGATLWVAPMVESFASPASAASSTAGCYVCFDGKIVDGAPSGNPFYAGQDNPGPAEAISNCTTEGNKLGLTSGSFILFNTTDPNGYWSSAVIPDASYCSYQIGKTGTAYELNNSCPPTYSSYTGTVPSTVTCQTGTW